MNPLSRLKPPAGAVKNKKRIGRGEGSGQGRTAGKGNKGQRARSGGTKTPWFEGGQMPLQRRLPKRGFHNIHRLEYTLVQIRDLNGFDPNSVVNAESLREAGVIRSAKDGLKVLGMGEIAKPLTVQAQKFSQSAKEKIEAAGGKAEVI